MAGKRQSYFDKAIQKAGQDFLDSKPVEEIQRDAKKFIFRDMAFGNIDYEKYGRYFMEPRFLEQLIVVAEDEMINHQYKAAALNEYNMKYPGNHIVIKLVTTETRLAQVYSIISNHLKWTKASNYNISILVNITSQISSYAQDLANI